MNIVRRVIDALRAYFQPRAPETETSDRLPSSVSIRGFNSEYVNFRKNLISTMLGLPVTFADYFFIGYFTLDGTRKPPFCYIYDDVSFIKVGEKRFVISTLGLNDPDSVPDNDFVLNIENFPRSPTDIKAFALSIQEVKSEWEYSGCGVILPPDTNEAERINREVLEMVMNSERTSETIQDILSRIVSEERILKRFEI